MKKQIYSVLLLLLMALLFVSCVDGGGIDMLATDEVSAETEAAENEIVLSEYTIIRPERADKTEISAAMALREGLKKAGLELPIADDHPSFMREKEILVGVTNRTESTVAAEGLTRLDYKISFTKDKIIIVGGSPAATASAVEYFISNYIKSADGVVGLVKKEEYVMKNVYKFEELDLKVVSLNLLTATNAQKNQQGEREPRISAFIADYKPDSIGVQECEIFWRMRLDSILTGYERAQEITTVTKNYIYYRTDRLKVVESGVFWLSETPETSSKGFGSEYYISCCWAIFESLENGSRYVHMNTHLDVNSEEIRKKELEVLLPRVQGFVDEGYAVLLTGDFNSKESSVIYKTIVNTGLKSSRYVAAVSDSMATFNGFKEDPSKYTGPIDYCFVNSEVKVAKYSVVDKHAGGFMSDHNALVIELTVYPR